MPDWTNASAREPSLSARPEHPFTLGSTSTHAGVLQPDQLARHVAIQRSQCDPNIARWVEGYWQLRWAIPAEQHYLSQVLPHPAVSLSVECGTARPGLGEDPVVVTGVFTCRFDVDLRGEGWACGVKFRPGGFAAMFNTHARGLRDQVVPAAALVPGHVHAVLSSIVSTTGLSDWTSQLDRSLMAIKPEPDQNYDLVLEVIAQMLADPTLTRVAEVEQQFGIGQRTLQRLFARYVGVSPKWVLSRYRMHDVVTALDNGYDGTLTDLATTYGWYDQAHFIRDFSTLVGTTPGHYRNADTTQ